MNFCAHLPPPGTNYYYSSQCPPPQVPRNPPGFGGGVFFHNFNNHPPVIPLPPPKKPPMVTNQPEFSLFSNPDYFGFYSTNIPQKEKNEVIPKLVFTDLNIASQEFCPGREWSPRSGSSSTSTTPRSNSSSNYSSPRSMGSPRKRIVVYPRIRK